MSLKTVRVFDFKNRTLTTIPAQELAPGMVRSTVQGIDGEVWVDASQALQGVYRHPPFPAATREKIREIKSIFHEVLRWSLDQWEDNFRRDVHADREIALWLHMGAIYRHFAGQGDLRRNEKKELFNVILMCATNGPVLARMTINAQTLPKKRVEQIIEHYFADHGQ